jgi:hypothetical protein
MSPSPLWFQNFDLQHSELLIPLSQSLPRFIFTTAMFPQQAAILPTPYKNKTYQPFNVLLF